MTTAHDSHSQSPPPPPPPSSMLPNLPPAAAFFCLAKGGDLSRRQTSLSVWPFLRSPFARSLACALARVRACSRAPWFLSLSISISFSFSLSRSLSPSPPPLTLTLSRSAQGYAFKVVTKLEDAQVAAPSSSPGLALRFPLPVPPTTPLCPFPPLLLSAPRPLPLPSAPAALVLSSSPLPPTLVFPLSYSLCPSSPVPLATVILLYLLPSVLSASLSPYRSHSAKRPGAARPRARQCQPLSNPPSLSPHPPYPLPGSATQTPRIRRRAPIRIPIPPLFADAHSTSAKSNTARNLRQGRDIFSHSRGAGKYGGTEMEKDLLQVRCGLKCSGGLKRRAQLP